QAAGDDRGGRHRAAAPRTPGVHTNGLDESGGPRGRRRSVAAKAVSDDQSAAALGASRPILGDGPLILRAYPPPCAEEHSEDTGTRLVSPTWTWTKILVFPIVALGLIGGFVTIPSGHAQVAPAGPVVADAEGLVRLAPRLDSRRADTKAFEFKASVAI